MVEATAGGDATTVAFRHRGPPPPRSTAVGGEGGTPPNTGFFPFLKQQIDFLLPLIEKIIDQKMEFRLGIRLN
jgi:hypothetical protein